MRIWFSGPRILGGLVRPGVSFGREDGLTPLGGHRSARLPAWRKHELMKRLQKAATGRGETMTKEDASDAVDKALETGALDRNGHLHLNISGDDPEDCIKRTIEAAAA